MKGGTQKGVAIMWDEGRKWRRRKRGERTATVEIVKAGGMRREVGVEEKKEMKKKQVHIRFQPVAESG